MAEYKTGAVCVWAALGFTMGLKVLLGVLGLQFCLLCLSYGVDTESQTALQWAELDPVPKTGHVALGQAEAALLGLGLKHEDSKVPGIMSMAPRPRQTRSEKKRRKKTGYASVLGEPSPSQDDKKTPAHGSTQSSRAKRHDGKPKKQERRKPKPKTGGRSPLGSSDG